MPAAAVIPAPIAYIKVVAVKKLVVGSRQPGGGSLQSVTAPFGCVIGGGFGVLFSFCERKSSEHWLSAVVVCVGLYLGLSASN